MTADCKEETQPIAEAAPVPSIKKEMKTLPIRILEEEVWFSGSELKTDNSSSDEEEGQASIRARRKTKMVSSSKSSQQTVMTQQRKEFSSTTTQMTMSTKIEESTSVQATATSSESHPNPIYHHEDIVPTKLNICTEYENLIATSGSIDNNQWTGETEALKKIKVLEEKILQAEQAYMAAKKETDRFVKELEGILENTEAIENPNWNFFNQLTRKWIQCISNVRSVTSYNPVKNRQKMSLVSSKGFSKDTFSVIDSKKSSKHIITIKKASNYSIVFRNIKQSSKAKLSKNMRTRKLTEAESLRLNHLLKNEEGPHSEKNGKTTNNPYQFTSSELHKMSKIDDKLKFCCGDSDVVSFTMTSKNEELNFSHKKNDVDGMKSDNDISDAESGPDSGLTAQVEDLQETSDDEFSSCDDD